MFTSLAVKKKLLNQNYQLKLVKNSHVERWTQALLWGTTAMEVCGFAKRKVAQH
jgi:hypothetical protein